MHYNWINTKPNIYYAPHILHFEKCFSNGPLLSLGAASQRNPTGLPNKKKKKTLSKHFTYVRSLYPVPPAQFVTWLGLFSTHSLDLIRLLQPLTARTLTYTLRPANVHRKTASKSLPHAVSPHPRTPHPHVMARRRRGVPQCHGHARAKIMCLRWGEKWGWGVCGKFVPHLSSDANIYK